MRLVARVPAWAWILIGWLAGGATRVALDDSLGADAGPVAFVVVVLVWTPALKRLAQRPRRHQAAFGMALLATVLVAGLLPGLESIPVRVAVEMALTGMAAARWIDGLPRRSATHG